MSSMQTVPHPQYPDPSPANATAGQGPADVPLLSSVRLLGSAGEAVIEHEGHRYRLRRTSRGGLVLTK